MLGTLVNTLTIILGSLLGGVLKKGIPEKYESSMLNACGLVACGVGVNSIVNNMSKSIYPVLFIISLVLGGIIGTKLELDNKINILLKKYTNGNLGEGIITGVLIFCIGSLSIIGPVMAALKKDYTFLFTNASLDLITSMVLASTYGIGMAFAAIILFLWQGSIYFLTKFVWMDFFSPELVTELCIIGGFLIITTGLNILKIKSFKTLDMLPSILIPVFFFVLKEFF
jgi:uncharacterized membrane protein YqgA involved in biofilm formation